MIKIKFPLRNTKFIALMYLSKIIKLSKYIELMNITYLNQDKNIFRKS